MEAKEDETEQRHGAYRAALTRFGAALAALRVPLIALEGVAASVRGREKGLIVPAFTPGVSTWLAELPERDVLDGALTEWHAAREALLAAHAALGADQQALAAPFPREGHRPR